MSEIYDIIGKTYVATRAADPRITRQLMDLMDVALGASILDVEAGTGNYGQAIARVGYHVSAQPSSGRGSLDVGYVFLKI